MILFSTTVTYISSLVIEAVKERQNDCHLKKRCMNICIVMNFALNLFILFYFKYFEFVISTINRLIRILGGKVTISCPDIILPVGISFYIFQALGYTIDVYRGEIKAEKNFFRYALFVSFFPQLVAGPIERSKNLLRQVNSPTYFEIENIRKGLLTMAYGLFMKVVVADRLASIIDPVYNNWSVRTGMDLMIATILFAIQIYCDFEGYSQLAIGSAQVLGFHINQNFRTPYLCTSVQEFWKRWHISLTNWFRDYLYIPLGGNRKGRMRKYLNTMIVFLTSGLWHGASWHFVAWGGVNGFYSILQDCTKSVREKVYYFLKIDTEAFLWKVFCGFVSFFFIDISWLLFRSRGIRQSLSILFKIWNDFTLRYFFSDEFYNMFGSTKTFSMTVFSLITVMAIDIFRKKNFNLKEYLLKQQFFFRWFVYLIVIFIIILWGTYGNGYEQTQFIYFQF
ncbi:MAG: MBOAT family protein [Lachnospiraceae bacterium]|nr:MBOAT family protein [Lachnospiraceae bacterium]